MLGLPLGFLMIDWWWVGVGWECETADRFTVTDTKCLKISFLSLYKSAFNLRVTFQNSISSSERSYEEMTTIQYDENGSPIND